MVAFALMLFSVLPHTVFVSIYSQKCKRRHVSDVESAPSGSDESASRTRELSLRSRDAFYSSSSLPSKARLVEEFVSIQKGLCRSWRLSEGTRKRQVGHGKRYMARGSRHTRGWTTVTLVGRST